LAFSPDGKQLVSASDDDKVMRMWLSSKKEWAVMYHSSFHSSQFQTRRGIWTERLGVRLAWSPGSVTLASASLGPTICLWNSDGTLQAELKGHEAQVWALDWSPDGNFLVSGSVDNTVRVWDSLSGVCLSVAHCLAPILALQFDKDGLTLRAADDGSSTSNRPIPYIFTICNIMARSSFEPFDSVSKTK
jgi:WD40 repeat protein